MRQWIRSVPLSLVLLAGAGVAVDESALDVGLHAMLQVALDYLHGSQAAG